MYLERVIRARDHHWSMRRISFGRCDSPTTTGQSVGKLIGRSKNITTGGNTLAPCESLWPGAPQQINPASRLGSPLFVCLRMNRRKLFRQGISEAEKSLNDPIHLLSRNRLLQIVDCPQCQCLLVPRRVGTPRQHDKRVRKLYRTRYPITRRPSSLRSLDRLARDRNPLFGHNASPLSTVVHRWTSIP